MLVPALEKLEREYAGRWKLVKINSDESPELSAQFQVRSIPYVVAFSGGKPVTSFLGVQPDGTLRAFLDALIPDPSEVEHRQARAALAQGQATLAEGHLKSALALDPSNDAARLDLVGILFGRGELDEARRQFDTLSGKASQESTFEPVKTRLEAAERAASLPSIEELERRVEKDGGDLQSRLDLAELRIAAGEPAKALDQLLEIVRRDRGIRDDIGRPKMLAVFEMGIDPELVTEYRRKLSGVLY